MIKQNRIYELDILRGLAAFLVAIFHITQDSTCVNFNYKIFNFGITLPSLFFIISGFVIFMTLEKTKVGIQFIITRFFRLYPSFWVSLILTVLFIAWLDPNQMPSFKLFMANFTMFPEMFRQNLIVGAYWTLLIEMQFYVIIFILIEIKWLKHIQLIIFSILILCSIIHISHYFIPKYLIVIRGLFPFISHAHLFFAGILFYQLKFDKVSKKDIKTHILILLCFLYTFMMDGKGGRVFYFMGLWEHIFINLIYFIIFYLFTFNKLKLPNFKPLIILGTISYNLYLLHQIIGKLIINVFCSFILNYYLALFLTLSIIGIISALVTYYIEIPIVKWSKKKFIKTTSI
jgi:peptidoglycan/LPS O-acetylase OafA/YrhL